MENENNALHSNCIIIGRNLQSKHSYHLLIDIGDIYVDKKMTEREFEIANQVIKSTAKENRFREVIHKAINLAT